MAGNVINIFGTQDKVTVATPAAVSSGAFSAASDVSDWTNDDNYPLAMFVLVLNNLSGAAVAGDRIDLYCKPLNIVNTSEDHTGPSSTIKSIYLGTIPIDTGDPAGTNEPYVLGPVSLPNVYASQVYEFYIYVGTASVGIDASAWELWVTPMSFGPSA